jgi:hypothetical protein
LYARAWQRTAQEEWEEVDLAVTVVVLGGGHSQLVTVEGVHQVAALVDVEAGRWLGSVRGIA